MNWRKERWHVTVVGSALAALLAVRVTTPLGQAGDLSPTTSSQGAQAVLPLKSELLARFHLAERVERKSSLLSTWTNREEILKVETIPNIDEEGAKMLVQEGVMNVDALYANALSPYPGDISRQIVTDPRFLPKLVRTNWNGRPCQYYLLFANERLGYGAVTADGAHYFSILGWIHCPAQGCFHKLRYFAPVTTPASDLERFFLSLSCP